MESFLASKLTELGLAPSVYTSVLTQAIDRQRTPAQNSAVCVGFLEHHLKNPDVDSRRERLESFREDLTRFLAKEKEAEEQVAKAKKEAEEQAAKEAEEQAAKEAEKQAAKEAEEKSRKEAEDKARKEAKDKARKETEYKMSKEGKEKARKMVEEKARKVVEEKARKEAEEKARKEKEEEAKRESEQSAADPPSPWKQRHQERKARDATAGSTGNSADALAGVSTADALTIADIEQAFSRVCLLARQQSEKLVKEAEELFKAVGTVHHALVSSVSTVF
jgi:hypothetical protein